MPLKRPVSRVKLESAECCESVIKAVLPMRFLVSDFERIEAGLVSSAMAVKTELRSEDQPVLA